jgi:hypothetical protein
MGIGLGLVGSAMAGAAVGAGEVGQQGLDYAAKATLADHAAEIQKLRDARMAELEQQTHRVNTATDIENLPARGAAETDVLKTREDALRDGKVETANRLPRTLPAGSSEVVDGKVVVTAPEKPLPQEHLDYYRAMADRMNAETAAIRNGDKYKAGGGKGQLPNIKVETDSDGNFINIDQNSGAVGRLIAKQDAKSSAWHMFSPNEPAKPAQEARIEWTYNGKVLPNGLDDLYPAIRGRIGTIPGSEGKQAGPALPRTDAEFNALPVGTEYINPKDGKTYTKIQTGWDKKSGEVRVAGQKIGVALDNADAVQMIERFKKDGKVAEPGASFTPAATAPSAFANVPDNEASAAYDAARIAHRAAIVRERTFGLVKQKMDPAGYQAARDEVEATTRALGEAQEAWARSVGGATDLTRPARTITQP